MREREESRKRFPRKGFHYFIIAESGTKVKDCMSAPS